MPQVRGLFCLGFLWFSHLNDPQQPTLSCHTRECSPTAKVKSALWVALVSCLLWWKTLLWRVMNVPGLNYRLEQIHMNRRRRAWWLRNSRSGCVLQSQISQGRRDVHRRRQGTDGVALCSWSRWDLWWPLGTKLEQDQFLPCNCQRWQVVINRQKTLTSISGWIWPQMKHIMVTLSPFSLVPQGTILSL